MFKMGSLLAFGTVYLLMHMHMCAWAQERSEESSVRFTVEFYIEVITSLIAQLDVVSLFSLLIFFSHSFCHKEQFIPNLSFGIGDFTDLGLLKIQAVLTDLLPWFCLYGKCFLLNFMLPGRQQVELVPLSPIDLTVCQE